MKKRTTVIILTTLLTVAVLIVGMVSCGKSDAAATNEMKDNVAAVSVSAVALVPFAESITLVGVVKAYDDVSISPEEGGIVKKWLKEKGDVVRKGEVLGMLDDEIIRAGYEAALAQYNIAQANFEKQEEVYKQQGISELQYKSLMYNRDAAKANMELAKARLTKRTIVSPINGVLDNRMKNEGEFAPPGVPVVRVVGLERVKILAEVPEKFAPAVKVGTMANIMFDVFGDDTVKARVTFVGPTLSSSNRTLPVEIEMQNPGGKLKAEMFGKAQIFKSQTRNTILIEEKLVQKMDETRRVVYVENGGKAEQRTVTTGARTGDLIEITSGLNPGDRLITAGFELLSDGVPVVVQN